MDRLNVLMLGAIAMAEFVTSLFFFRFWRTGRDRFFLLFALSFFVDAANRVVLSLSERPHEGSPIHYVVRFLSFLLIIVAVLMKNRRGRSDTR